MTFQKKKRQMSNIRNEKRDHTTDPAHIKHMVRGGPKKLLQTEILNVLFSPLTSSEELPKLLLKIGGLLDRRLSYRFLGSNNM